MYIIDVPPSRIYPTERLELIGSIEESYLFVKMKCTIFWKKSKLSRALGARLVEISPQ